MQAKVWWGVVFVMLSMGCKSRSHNQSKLLHGHLDRDDTDWLIQVLPDQHLTICGDHTELGLEAAKKWAVPIKRDTLIKFSSNCDPNADHKVWILAFNGKYADEAKAECQQYDFRFNFALPDARRIYLCVERSVGWSNVLLHEFGHLWGMCDQYKPREGHTTNCDPNNATSQQVAESVMANTSYTELQEDDRMGIMAAALRLDLKANEEWSKRVKIDGPELSKVQSNECNRCGSKIAAQRYCGVFSVTYDRWVRGDYVACDENNPSLNRCNGCSLQKEGYRFCGIFNKEWGSGDWVPCI
jgi:hypothetical protein